MKLSKSLGKIKTIYKPVGVTSRLWMKINGIVGHIGTLDYAACGLLIHSPDKKLYQQVLDAEKTYIFKILWGFKSDSLDVENSKPVYKFSTPTKMDIFNYFNSINGKERMFYTPLYSSKKNLIKTMGKKIAYKIKSGKVTFFKINSHTKDSTTLTVTVTTGVYIRGIVFEICKSYNTFGIAFKIFRIKVGNIPCPPPLSNNFDYNGII